MMDHDKVTNQSLFFHSYDHYAGTGVGAVGGNGNDQDTAVTDNGSNNNKHYSNINDLGCAGDNKRRLGRDPTPNNSNHKDGTWIYPPQQQQQQRQQQKRRNRQQQQQQRSQNQPQSADFLQNLVVAYQESLIASATSTQASSSSLSTNENTQQKQEEEQEEAKKGGDNNAINQQQQQQQELSDLTKTLNELSVRERERATYDVHGIAPPLTQEMHDPQSIERALTELDALLVQYANATVLLKPSETDHHQQQQQQQQQQQHPGLAMAFKLNPTYLQSQRMKFLRSDEYDPVKAAERMAGYFDRRLEYFCNFQQQQQQQLNGIESESTRASTTTASSSTTPIDYSCMTRDLSVLDLTDDDVRYWKTGFYQVCREKDRGGRIVCVIFLPLCYQLQIPAESMVRINFVVNTILTQNVDVQLSGNVHIAWAVGLGPDSMEYIGKDKTAKIMVEAGKYAPMRGVAKHFCYDDESLHPMFLKYAKPMSTFSAVRFRSHFGSQSEVSFNLSTFGISIDSLPISSNGIVQTEFHCAFVDSLIQQQRQRNEELQQIADLELQDIMPDEDFELIDIESPDELTMSMMNMPVGVLTDLDNTVPEIMGRQSVVTDNIQGIDRVDHNIFGQMKFEPHGTFVASSMTVRIPEDQTVESQRPFVPGASLPVVQGRDAALYSSSLQGSNPGENPILPSTIAVSDSIPRSDNSVNSDLSTPLSNLQPMDVIFGRGSHNKNNPGNLRLKALLDEHKQQYDMSNRTKKSEIVGSIMEQMKSTGSRFVYEVYDDDSSRSSNASGGGSDGGGGGGYKPKWMVASNERIKNKITHDFRNLRRSKKPPKSKN